MKFWKWLKSLFKTKKDIPVSEKPIDEVVIIINPAPIKDAEESGTIEAPEKIVKPDYKNEVVTLQFIANSLIYEASKHVGAKEKGNNTDRGGEIDDIILDEGGKLGWAWCQLFVCDAVMDVCRALGIGYPEGLYRGASTQSCWKKTDKKYISKVFGYAFSFIYTYPDDKSKGHTGIVIRKNSDGSLYTIEGNASNMITNKTQPKYLVDELSCYVNLPQAILDQYNREKTK